MIKLTTTHSTTARDVALVGGGQYLQPKEFSLLHNGVLFFFPKVEIRIKTLTVSF